MESQKIVCGSVSMSHAPVMLGLYKVLPSVVKFYQEIFHKICFSNKLRQVLLKLPRNNQSFLIQLQVAEHHCMSYWIFPNFSCVLILSSVLIFSVLFSPHFARMQWKYSLISVKWLILMCLVGTYFSRLRKGYFCKSQDKCCHKKKCLYKYLTMVFFEPIIISVSKLVHDFLWLKVFSNSANILSWKYNVSPYIENFVRKFEPIRIFL